MNSCKNRAENCCCVAGDNARIWAGCCCSLITAVYMCITSLALWLLVLVSFIQPDYIKSVSICQIVLKVYMQKKTADMYTFCCSFRIAYTLMPVRRTAPAQVNKACYGIPRMPCLCCCVHDLCKLVHVLAVKSYSVVKKFCLCCKCGSGYKAVA